MVITVPPFYEVITSHKLPQKTIRNSKDAVHFLSDAWCRHQMETYSALLALCAGNSPVTGKFPSQRPVTQSLDVFFDLRLNKRLGKQSRGWWLVTPSRSLWRHCNGITYNPPRCLWNLNSKREHICISQITDRIFMLSAKKIAAQTSGNDAILWFLVSFYQYSKCCAIYQDIVNHWK